MVEKKNNLVQTQKFVLVLQNVGEDERDCLVSAERFSRDANLSFTDDARR